MSVYVQDENGITTLLQQDLTQDVIENIMAIDNIEMSPCGATTLANFKAQKAQTVPSIPNVE